MKVGEPDGADGAAGGAARCRDVGGGQGGACRLEGECCRELLTSGAGSLPIRDHPGWSRRPSRPAALADTHATRLLPVPRLAAAIFGHRTGSPALTDSGQAARRHVGRVAAHVLAAEGPAALTRQSTRITDNDRAVSPLTSLDVGLHLHDAISSVWKVPAGPRSRDRRRPGDVAPPALVI